MKITHTHRQARTGLERHLGPRNEAPRDNVSNIIPFPGVRGSHRQPAKRGPRSFTLLLGQALRHAGDRLRRLTGSPHRVSLQPQPGAGTAAGARYPAHPDSKLSRFGVKPIRKRMSA